MIYSSAPSYPHGIIDPISELGEIAHSHGCGLFVDGCLGGFVLPFAKQLGYDIPDFDFSVKGVTAMSLDTHKYGYASKGTSVVLYKTPALRRYQFFLYPQWPGGLYTTPTIAGSRNGSIVCSAWATMQHLGTSGYLEAVDSIMKTRLKLLKGIKRIPGLEVVGEPLAMVIGMRSTEFNIYELR